MTAYLAKNAQWMIGGGIVAALVFAIAWQSRLFGLNMPTETVRVRAAGASNGQGHVSTDGPGASDGASSAPARKLDIVTLLPFDAIPAIFAPRFVSAEDADRNYRADEKVLGVSINGDSRAYSVPMLSRHEIVNDTVGGVKIAITW